MTISADVEAGLKASDAAILGRTMMLQEAIIGILVAHPNRQDLAKRIVGLSYGLLQSSLNERRDDPFFSDLVSGAQEASNSILEALGM